MSDNDTHLSKEALLQRIKELETELRETKKETNDQFLIEFPWAGNLGMWRWDVADNKVVFNEKKVRQLGYHPKTIGEVGFEFFTQKLHPDDYEPVMQNMRDHLSGKTDAYETEYRIQHLEGHYLWYYDRGVITKRDQLGRPLVLEGIVFDISESKRVMEKLRLLSETDSLTQTFNRRIFYQDLNMLISQFYEQENPFSLMMLDIDFFKHINDKHGHLVGDDILKTLTKIIMQDKRLEDKVYRYGGDEFFILLPNTDANGAKKLAERLHRLIQNNEIPKIGCIKVSMGVAEYHKGESIDDLITRVDNLLYKAKEAGRNQIKS